MQTTLGIAAVQCALAFAPGAPLTGSVPAGGLPALSSRPAMPRHAASPGTV